MPNDTLSRPSTAASTLAVRPDLNALMAKAMDSGPEGVAMLKELVALSREVEADNARKAFHDALRAFQNDCPSVHKNKQMGGTSRSGGSLSYKFADLDQIVSTVRPILDKHGLSFTFDCEVSEAGIMRTTCRVRHKDGHSEASSFSCPAQGGNDRVNVQQQTGGAYTFSRRYALIGALGIATTDDDTDGRSQQQPATSATAYITDDDAMSLEARIDEVQADLPAFLRYFKIETVADLPAARLAEARTMLARKGQKARP